MKIIVRGGPAGVDRNTFLFPEPDSDSDGSNTPTSPVDTRWNDELPPNATDAQKEAALQQRWNNIVRLYGDMLDLRGFTKDPQDLVNDRAEADAIIMPSLHEGFGLVATEGAGEGIPVLVNAESGAGDFLRFLGYDDSVTDSSSNPIERSATGPRRSRISRRTSISATRRQSIFSRS